MNLILKYHQLQEVFPLRNELEYIDELTLGTAITSRVPYENSVSSKI